jgi:hypothetical protein
LLIALRPTSSVLLNPIRLLSVPLCSTIWGFQSAGRSRNGLE